MRILEITQPQPHQPTSEVVTALAVHSSAIRQQITGSNDLSFSTQQLTEDMLGAHGRVRLFACVNDDAQELEGTQRLGDILPGSIPAGQEDPTVALDVLGWAELHLPASQDADQPAWIDITISANIYPMPGDPTSTHVRDVVETLLDTVGAYWEGPLVANTFATPGLAPKRSVIGRILYDYGFELERLDTVAYLPLNTAPRQKPLPAGFAATHSHATGDNRIDVTVSGHSSWARCTIIRPANAPGTSALAHIDTFEASPCVIIAAIRESLHLAHTTWPELTRIYSDDANVITAMRQTDPSLSIAPIASRGLWRRPGHLTHPTRTTIAITPTAARREKQPLIAR
ncbi:hypothetical protein [Corynebacterium aquilae]|uniref:Uncharacterized protein n=1 Tax=Corynebacterium aquilae DSM 44791 TaxID=1431546 RepID=A0A1L7CHA0_9CORY|nr:hypothetical protein [Corynebacterium aquilae]APT85240.1 hypothetical protein CAQU_09330 [Corynebacterium aquilae DSM 44791]